MKDSLLELFEKLGFFNKENQEFIEPEEPVGPTENVVGEMNELEKTLFTFVCLAPEKCKEFHSRNSTSEEALAHIQYHESVKLADKMLWVSIRSRYPEPLEASGMGIRKGFVIVEKYEQEESQRENIINKIFMRMFR